MSLAVLCGVVWGVLLWFRARRARRIASLAAAQGSLRDLGGRGGF